VEGLDEGNWAVLSKTHHALVDGVSGTDVLAVIMDLSPDQPPLPRLPWEPDPYPSALNLAVDASLELLRSPYEQVNALRHAVSVPRQALEQGVSVLRGLMAMTGLAKRTPTSTLNGPLGPHRRYGWASTTVGEIKAIRNELGGTFNDVVLAAITNGFRELLLSRGESVDRFVRTLVPVSVRPRNESGLAVGDGTLENKVSAMFAELPVSIADAPERLRAVSRQMAGVKDSHQAVAGEALTSMTGFAPPMLLALGMRVSTRMAQHQVNTVTTNVPGPQIPLYMGGRQMIRAFPYVPLGAQMRIGIAIFSYNGEVSFGVTGDYDTTEDLDVLCQGIEEGIRQMRKTDVQHTDR
jgi:diacylglycerol O-acyltransferase / wax synthase